MRSPIKPVDPSMHVAGPACTAWAYPGGTHASELALNAAEPGQVIVLDGKGYLEAVLWGEIFSHMAVAKGIAGTVIDGAVRDIGAIRQVGLPVFCRGVHGAGISRALVAQLSARDFGASAPRVLATGRILPVRGPFR